VAVYRLDLEASGMIRPHAAALRAGAGQLLIPPDPAIAAIGKVSHITEASPGSVLPPDWLPTVTVSQPHPATLSLITPDQMARVAPSSTTQPPVTIA
jgi:hypothetical protein